MKLTREEWLEIPKGYRPMKPNNYPDYVDSDDPFAPLNQTLDAALRKLYILKGKL